MPIRSLPRENRIAVAAALAAYTMWGFLPILFNAMHGAASLQVVAHRVIWGMLFLVVVVSVKMRWGVMAQIFRNPRLIAQLALSATFIAANWLLYILAVRHGHVLEASLGYFINPLVNVLLGIVVLGERLRRVQMVAVGLATAGVVIFAVEGGSGPWMALALAFTFSIYGLLRKIAAVPSLEGLMGETTLLFPMAAGYLLLHPGVTPITQLPIDTAVLLVLTGPATAMPLLLFTFAAQRMPYSTLGLFQYTSPTIQFVLALAMFHEPFKPIHALVFGLIWGGLALYVRDTFLGDRAAE